MSRRTLRVVTSDKHPDARFVGWATKGGRRIDDFVVKVYPGHADELPAILKALNPKRLLHAVAAVVAWGREHNAELFDELLEAVEPFMVDPCPVCGATEDDADTAHAIGYAGTVGCALHQVAP